MKIGLTFALLVIFNVIIFLIDDTTQLKSILIIILYDGFRNDYLDRGITPTLNNFRRNGVSSKYLYTVYPALGIPSMHSIATGLHPITHGIRLRYQTDADGTKVREATDNEAYTQNYSLPIWALNEKYGGKSACICWPGQDATYNGSKCTLTLKYDKETTLKTRADKLIEYLNKTVETEVPNVIMFYVEELDRITHFFGPFSRNSSLMIRRLDLLTKYILTKLMEINAYHRSNIFILSDHGMRALREIGSTVIKDDNKKKYNASFQPTPINKVDDINGIVFVVITAPTEIINYTTATQEFVKLGKNENLFTVVRVPPGANNTKGNEVEYAACPGYAFDLTRWKIASWNSLYHKFYGGKDLKAPEGADGPYGVHGYLRQNDAMFMAKGPNIAMFKIVDPFEMVDLYSAFVKLLHIQGDYENEGNFSRVLPILHQHGSINWTVILVTIAGLAVIFAVIFCGLIEYLLNSVEQPVPDEAVTEEPVRSERGSTEPVRSVRVSTEPAQSERSSTEPVRSVRGSTEPVPNETTQNETVATEAAPTEAAPTEAAPTEAAPTEAAPTEAAPTKAAPTEAAPTEAAATEAVPTRAAPTEAAPTEAAPTEPVPKEAAPIEATPKETTPTETTPTEAAPTQAAPTEPIPKETAPKETNAA